jgi:hypothetical protein
MRTTVNFSTFYDAFQSMDYRKDTFSYHGLRALFEWLEEYEDATGVEMELDVVGLCCEFTEYDSVEEVLKNYDNIQTLDDIPTSYRMTDTGSIIVEDF